MDELVAASQLPTWTNIAYHKYYANGKPVANSKPVINGRAITNGYGV